MHLVSVAPPWKCTALVFPQPWQRSVCPARYPELPAGGAGVECPQCYLWHRPSGKAGSCPITLGPLTRGAGYPLHGGPEDGGFLLLAEGCPEACAEPWLSTICLPSPAGLPEHLCALHRSRGTVGHLGARCPSHTSLPIAHGCEVGSPKPQVGFRF